MPDDTLYSAEMIAAMLLAAPALNRGDRQRLRAVLDHLDAIEDGAHPVPRAAADVDREQLELWKRGAAKSAMLAP